jgi:hypothetical protein
MFNPIRSYAWQYACVLNCLNRSTVTSLPSVPFTQRQRVSPATVSCPLVGDFVIDQKRMLKIREWLAVGSLIHVGEKVFVAGLESGFIDL